MGGRGGGGGGGGSYCNVNTGEATFRLLGGHCRGFSISSQLSKNCDTAGGGGGGKEILNCDKNPRMCTRCREF